MNRFRQKHPDHGSAIVEKHRDDSRSVESDSSLAVEDIDSVAAGHRETVKAKDAAAKARKAKGRRRG